MGLFRRGSRSSSNEQDMDEMSLQYRHPGTIQIDCSGAFIARDNHDSTWLSTEEVSSDEALRDSTSSSEDSDVSSEFELEYDGDQTKNITLPSHNSEVVHIALDIGGTLTKLVYFTKNITNGSDSEDTGGKLHFKFFQTTNFKSQVLKFLIKLIKKSNNNITHILATGGGSYKFNDLMRKTFKGKINIIAEDEMKCLINGLDFFIKEIPREIFTYDMANDSINIISNKYVVPSDIYPYLLVNIGSGVSMIKVTGPNNNFERIGGSSLGGGTLWGLLSLLTDAKDYNEMLEMAKNGNNENIDLLVGDIYGTNYSKIGLKANHIASSFAKVFKKIQNEPRELTIQEKLAKFNKNDISRSLLYSISNNIGQIAYLQAQRYNLKRIYFGGSYISGHKQTIHTLTYAVNFWSKGDMQAYFLRHEGYLGSVGAFLMGPNPIEKELESANSANVTSSLVTTNSIQSCGLEDVKTEVSKVSS